MTDIIKQIETALKDGACESVTVKLKNRYGTQNWNISHLPFIRGRYESVGIESFTLNFRKFDDLDVGDLVATPNGNSTITRQPWETRVGRYVTTGQRYFHRHELILLERGNND